MKFSVKKNDILPLLTRVNNIIDKKSTQKIRSNVLIRAKDDNIELTGFDSEIKISGNVVAKIEETGATTVNALKLFDIIRSSATDDIEISVADNNMLIVCENNKIQLVTIPATDYPLPDSYTFEQSLTVDCGAFASLINAVKFSMATNDVRHHLNGMLLDFKSTNIVSASTDGHRLSVAEIENVSDISDKKIILPRKAVMEIYAWLTSNTGEVAIDISATHINFSHNNVQITSALINAEYPNYESVIPAISDKLIIIPKNKFKEALQRAKILYSDYGTGITLLFQSWAVMLSAKNVDNESFEDKIDINYDGEEIKIAFNINYLIDVISVIESDNLTLSLRDNKSSCLIFDQNKETARYIVMPMDI